MLLLGCVLFVSCKDATQVRLIVRTNVSYAAGVNVAVWSSASGTRGPAPDSVSAEPWLNDGTVGDLVVVPRDRVDGPLTLQITMGIGRDASTCSEADATGCIVARRKLAFVPHVGLRVPVVLHLACESVVCSPDTTCNYLGQCVSAAVDPQACANADGCVLEGDERVTGTIPRPQPDADTGAGEASVEGGVSKDAGADALADAGTDALADAGTDAGPLGPSIVPAGVFNCARFDNGQVKCWGRNARGQLGLGNNQDRGDGPGEMGASLPFVDLGPGRTAVSLASGEDHTCALLDNGQVKCWGDNASGELGLGDTAFRGDNPGEMGANLPAVDLGGGPSVLSLAAGAGFSCARFNNGQVKCWGRNDFGQLGRGGVLNRGDGPGEMGANLVAVDFGAGRTAVDLVAGGYHACVRLDNAELRCWGRNGQGQLGLGDNGNRGDAPNELGANLPRVDLGPGRTATRIAGGALHTCALLDNGQLKCWGQGTSGQLGAGTSQNYGDGPGEMGASLPVVDLGPGRTAVSVGAGVAHTCARLDNGQVKCWGDNGFGQLGQGNTQNRGDGPGEMGANLLPVDLGAGRSALVLAVGAYHACVRLDDLQFKCWGYNLFGQLGVGDTQNRGDGPGELGANLPTLVLP